MARRSEAQERADAARKERADQHVAALEAELEGYEARRKAAKGDEASGLDDRIKDVKSAITAAKKGHGVGPEKRVTKPAAVKASD